MCWTAGKLDGRHLDHELAGGPASRPWPRAFEGVQRRDARRQFVASHRQRHWRRPAGGDAPRTDEARRSTGSVASGAVGRRRRTGADREDLGALHRDGPDRRVERSLGPDRGGRNPAADRPPPEAIERHELPIGRQAGDLVRRKGRCRRGGRRLGDLGHPRRGRPSGRRTVSRRQRVAPRAQDRHTDDHRGGDRDSAGRGSPAGDGSRGNRKGTVHASCPTIRLRRRA